MCSHKIVIAIGTKDLCFLSTGCYRTSPRSVSRNSTPLLLFELPSVPEEGVSVCSPPLSLGNSSPIQTPSEGQQEKMINENMPETLCSNMPDETEALTRTGGDGSMLERCLNFEAF